MIITSIFPREKKSEIKLQCYRMEELCTWKDCEGRNLQRGETEVLRDTEVIRITSVVEGMRRDELLAVSSSTKAASNSAGR